MKKIPGKYKFLIIVGIMYIVAAVVNLELVKTSLVDFGYIFMKIIRILGLVLIIMTVMNVFLNSKKSKQYLTKSKGWKSWIFAIIAWILIWWPPYVLYPMLGEMKKQGMSNTLLSVFLYNRNVKIPFIPISIVYFGATFTVVFSIYIVLFSVLNGIVIGKLVPSE